MTKEGAVGVLPSWNLADLYNGTSSEDLRRDIADVAAAAKLLSKTHQGHVGMLGPDDFAKAIKTYESQVMLSSYTQET